MKQETLFPETKAGSESLAPEGLRYQPDFITEADERALVGEMINLPLKPFEFHGYFGNRRVISFGFRYDYARRGVDQAEQAPSFLAALRPRIAAFARRAPEEFKQIGVFEYRPGAGIGWHRDKKIFEDVIGISLLTPCNFRLRRKKDVGWERISIEVNPRSAYLLSGPSRSMWEHSIPPLDQLRYSITFRTFSK